MTPQEIFDKVVAHLRQQNCKSVLNDADFCAYRGMNGTKCAGGVLIEDDEYADWMEGTNISGILMREIPDSLRARLEPHRALISTLQKAHDSCDVQEWEKEFKHIARLYQVKYTPRTGTL